jgi:hypothetical protein
MKPNNIELQIEELVLHGFSPGDRYHIGQVVEHELGRMFAERGAPPSLTRSDEIPSLEGGTFKVKPGSRVEEIGAQVAQAVYRGLGA